MNELDLLKTHWQKEDNYIKFKKEDILNMIHKSSSSIVKWIFIISAIEVFLLLMINIYFYQKEDSQHNNYELILDTLNYTILIVFVYLFYQQYRRIKTFTNTRSLSNSILKTRKLVKKFVIANLLIFGFHFLIGIITDSHFNAFREGYEDGYTSDNVKTSQFNESAGEFFFWIIFSILSVIIFLTVYYYYKIVYMRLTNKLKKNYEELVRLEEE